MEGHCIWREVERILHGFRAACETVRQGRHEKSLPISCALAIAFIGGIVGYSPATLGMRIPPKLGIMVAKIPS